MNNHPKHMSKKAGLPPGSLIHIGQRKSDKVRISVIDYNEKDYSETICQTVEECFAYKDKTTESWINIDGLHDIETIAKIGSHFELHGLLLEDILNTRHRPKVEEFDNCLFLTLKMLGISKNGQEVITEQVSFVLGKTWLVSFQEQAGDIFDALRQRLREDTGTARKKGIDYLLYRLVDTVVDNYFFITEHFSEASTKLEERVLRSPDNQSLQEIQRLKRLLVNFRKSVAPLREAVASLEKDSSSLIEKGTRRYLRDVYEHIIQLSEAIETQRDMLAGIMDLYLSGVSNKMNQVMQVLTIIATIFIPLTFIAGIYGMNFDNMPELHWKYGYFGIWGFMIIIGAIMVIYFKRKRWL